MTTTKTTTATAAKEVSLEQLAERVRILLINGKSAEARAQILQIIDADVTGVKALHQGFKMMLALKDFSAALDYIDRALAQVPEQPVFTIEKAQLLLRMNKRQDALALLAHAQTLMPDNLRYLHSIAQIYSQLDLPELALPILVRVSESAPADINLRYELALAQFFNGDMKAAKANLDAVIAARPDAAEAIHVRSTLNKATPKQNHVAFLTERANPSKPEDAPVWFALGKELEDLGQDDEAFKAFVTANKLKSSKISYHESAELGALQNLIRSTQELELPRASTTKTKVTPIFVVSLPRTGSTLIDRMLDSHSDIKSIGELQDFPRLLAEAIEEQVAQSGGKLSREAAVQHIDYAALGARYQANIEALADGHAYVVDKLPFNFMYCGLIRKALPHAKIVHVQRDLMDTGYAIFKTLFNQAYLYSYEQKHLARYLAAYTQVMEHWRAKLGKHLIEVSYENVIEAPEAAAQALFKQLKISWQPEVMKFNQNQSSARTASAAQVREPVYASSVGKWQRHAIGLKPLLLELQKHGLAPDNQ